MDIITTDFETHYTKDYSLSKMTTEAYIRDDRFEVIGVGVKVNGEQADWYSGEFPGRFLDGFRYDNKAILAHNTAFDGGILGWHFDITPKLWLDTLSMSKPLLSVTVGASLKNLAAYFRIGEKGDEVLSAIGKHRSDFTPQELAAYGAYCLNDVEMAYKLYNKMKRSIGPQELLLIDRTMRMYTEPELELDVPLLTKYLGEVRDKKSSLVEDLGMSCTEEEAKAILMSNDKFGLFLKSLGVEPPTKYSVAKKSLTYAFSKSDRMFLKLKEHEDSRVANAVMARLGIKSTIEETRTKRMLDVASRGKLPVMLKYYAAHTGRFGGGDKMNMQNFARMGTLRKAIRAPKGKVLIACDSSQIEARIVAWLAGQMDLLEAFRQGRDIYSEFATYIYGKTITKADKVERFCGKASILGLGYNMGWEKFLHTLAIGQGGVSLVLEESEAKRIVQAYRKRYPRIPALWNVGNHVLQNMVNNLTDEFRHGIMYSADGFILPNGLPLKYHGLRQTPDGFEYVADARAYREMVKARVRGEELEGKHWTHIYGGKTVENLTQALARIVVTEQLLEISMRYKVVLQVHDEIVICVDAKEAAEAKRFMLEVMSRPPAWAPDLPVACEAAMGATYGDCK